MQTETVEIEVVIDRQMKVVLTIPKKMDIAEITALTQRLQKIAKISPLPISLKKNGKRNGLDFTKDKSKAIEVIKKWYADKEGREALAQSYGRDKESFEPLIYYAKKKLKITDKEIGLKK
jgi:hypothetical protein